MGAETVAAALCARAREPIGERDNKPRSEFSLCVVTRPYATGLSKTDWQYLQAIMVRRTSIYVLHEERFLFLFTLRFIFAYKDRTRFERTRDGERQRGKEVTT
jgi:hypothetical protein